MLTLLHSNALLFYFQKKLFEYSSITLKIKCDTLVIIDL